jgi:hypothetical protein
MGAHMLYTFHLATTAAAAAAAAGHDEVLAFEAEAVEGCLLHPARGLDTFFKQINAGPHHWLEQHCCLKWADGDWRLLLAHASSRLPRSQKMQLCRVGLMAA